MSVYLTEFRRTMHSGYRMRRRCGVGRLCALWVTWCDARDRELYVFDADGRWVGRRESEVAA